MLLAARDAQGFVEGLDEAAFLASPLHQNATIRSVGTWFGYSDSRFNGLAEGCNSGRFIRHRNL
jgi:hypothetical protein